MIRFCHDLVQFRGSHDWHCRWQFSHEERCVQPTDECLSLYRPYADELLYR